MSIKSKLEKEIEIESNRIENAGRLKLKDGPAENSEPKKVVKTRRRDIPANLVGLFFYYLFQATASTGAREDKAKVVSKLTNFAESTIKAMLSNPLADEDKEGFDGHFKVVLAMFKLIGYADAYELMKRDGKSK